MFYARPEGVGNKKKIRWVIGNLEGTHVNV